MGLSCHCKEDELLGIKTQRGKTWSNSSVHSVLKRMHERDVRIEGVRNKKYPIKISKMVIRCHTV